MPVIGAGARYALVGGIAEDNGFAALIAQAGDIFRGIVNIDMRSYRAFVVHETDVPVGDIVIVQPVNGLGYGRAVRVFKEQTVGDNADADFLAW